VNSKNGAAVAIRGMFVGYQPTLISIAYYVIAI
jgi:hypothetical protein